MFFQSVWLDDLPLTGLAKKVRSRFDGEYRARYGTSRKRGLYQDADWARISFCYAKLKEVGGSVLDVGAGPGALLNLLCLDGTFNRVTGIDIRQYSTLVSLIDLDIQIMDVGEMKFPDKSFDVVVCMEVLEHLDASHFKMALGQLRRVASKCLFITVPFREQEPLAPYHKLRFDFEDLHKNFPTGEYYLLNRTGGRAWAAIVETL